MEMLEPLEAAVLVAVSRGLKTVKEIARALNVHPSDVEKVVERLVSKGLLCRRRKGWLRRRVELCLSGKGYNVLPAAISILENIARRIREARLKPGSGHEEVTQHEVTLLDTSMFLLPFLVWLGLLPLELLSIEEALEDSTHTAEGWSGDAREGFIEESRDESQEWDMDIEIE